MDPSKLEKAALILDIKNLLFVYSLTLAPYTNAVRRESEDNFEDHRRNGEFHVRKIPKVKPKDAA